MAIQITSTHYDDEEFFSRIREITDESVKRQLTELKKIQEPEKSIFTRQETAKTLGISLPTLHLYTKTNIIRAYRLGPKVRYKLSDIEDALKVIRTGRNRDDK